MGKVKEPAAIIGEGITEKYYIESLKDLRELSPKPKFFKTTNATAKEYENKIKESIEKDTLKFTVYSIWILTVKIQNILHLKGNIIIKQRKVFSYVF